MKSKKGISLIVLVITIIVIIILAAAVILNLTKNNPMNNAKIASAVQSRDSLESSITLYLSKAIADTQGLLSAEQLITGTGSNDISTEEIFRRGTEDYRLAKPSKVGQKAQENQKYDPAQPNASSYATDAVYGDGSKDDVVTFETATGYHTLYRLATEKDTTGLGGLTTANINNMPSSGTAIDNSKINITDAKFNRTNELLSFQNMPGTTSGDAFWYIDATNGKIYLVFNEGKKVPQWMTKDGQSTAFKDIENENLLTFILQKSNQTQNVVLADKVETKEATEITVAKSVAQVLNTTP